MTPDTKALSELVERVKKAEGPDRELDRALMSLAYRWGRRKLGVQESCATGWRNVMSNCWIDRETDRWVTTAKQGFEFTASLDAALALVERVLPGARVMVERTREGTGWAMVQRIGEHRRHMEEAKTPALALLATLLVARLSSLSPELAGREG